MQVAALKIEQKKRGISDADYRALLMRETGKTSSTLLTDDERKRVYLAMTRPRSTPVASAPKTPTESKIWALWYDLKQYLPESEKNVGYLMGFVRRACSNQMIDQLRELSQREAHQTIEALKQRLQQEQDQLNNDVPF